MADDLIRDDEEEAGEGESWLTTFSDVSMLLLCFFVLLLSMSTVNSARFRESFSSVRDVFGGAQQKDTDFTDTPSVPEKVEDMVRMQEQLREQQRHTFNDVRSFIAQHAVDDAVQATMDEGIITLRVPSEMLFDKGSEQLKPSGREFLNSMRDLFLKTREQNIDIRGYTDNSPVPAGARFRNNWELSALRAVNVLRDLLEGGIEPVRMTATGLGDLDPLAPNTTEANKAKNRRVEFILQRRVGH